MFCLLVSQVSGLVEKSEENQVSTLIYSMGDNADDIFQAYKLSVEDMKKYDTVKGKFDNYFIKKKNIIYERAKFKCRRQEESEPVDVFITVLYNLAEKCEYKSLHDEMIRDRIVVGIADQVLSERMQVDENLTLEKAAKMARQSEAVKKQQPEIRGTTTKEDLDAIKTGKHKALKQTRPTPQSHASNPSRRPPMHPKRETACTRCGKAPPHGRDTCPAKDSKCYRCGKTGHFKNKCRSSVNDIRAKEDKEQFLGVIGQNSSTREGPWMIELKMNKQPITFKIDTGADVTVISDKLHKKIRDGPLKPATRPLIGPSQNPLTVLGHFVTKHESKDRTTTDTIYVVKNLRTPLVGRPAIQKLQLISWIKNVVWDKTQVTTQFPELFEGLGRISGNYRIQLEGNAKPYSVHTPRRISIPLLPKVKQELARMEKLGVISKIDEPTDWCSGMVVVPKPNEGVRICVDLTRMNRHVKRERHILPSVDHVMAQIGDAKIFSKLDANSGFWQIELAPESAKLTTFITPYGVVGLIDDILVHGRTTKEHHKRLMVVLERLKKRRHYTQ